MAKSAESAGLAPKEPLKANKHAHVVLLPAPVPPAIPIVTEGIIPKCDPTSAVAKILERVSPEDS